MEKENKTTEKLNSELKAFKIITGALIGVLTLLITISIYGLITKENKTTYIASIVVSISLSAILPVLFVNIKNIKNKLNERN